MATAPLSERRLLQCGSELSKLRLASANSELRIVFLGSQGLFQVFLRGRNHQPGSLKTLRDNVPLIDEEHVCQGGHQHLTPVAPSADLVRLLQSFFHGLITCEVGAVEAGIVEFVAAPQIEMLAEDCAVMIRPISGGKDVSLYGWIEARVVPGGPDITR